MDALNFDATREKKKAEKTARAATKKEEDPIKEYRNMLQVRQEKRDEDGVCVCCVCVFVCVCVCGGVSQRVWVSS